MHSREPLSGYVLQEEHKEAKQCDPILAGPHISPKTLGSRHPLSAAAGVSLEEVVGKNVDSSHIACS